MYKPGILIFTNNSSSKLNKKNPTHHFVDTGQQTTSIGQRLSEEVYKFVKKTTSVKYYFKQIHNSQASKSTKKLTTLQVFYVQLHGLKFVTQVLFLGRPYEYQASK